MTSAIEEASAFLAWPSTRRWRGTSCVSTICDALPAVVLTAPSTNATRYSSGIDSTSIHQASGTTQTDAAVSNSPTTYTGSFLTRSSQTPLGRENSTNGTISIAVSTPICVADAFSSTAAVSGNASSDTWLPKELISVELHRRR
jgi:hypothetical protein